METLALIIIIVAAFVVGFGCGVIAGYHTGYHAGRVSAFDELQPSYEIFVTELSKVKPRLKDLNKEF